MLHELEIQATAKPAKEDVFKSVVYDHRLEQSAMIKRVKETDRRAEQRILRIQRYKL